MDFGTMTENYDIILKMKTSRLYELCQKLYKHEFDYMFSAPRNQFRDWLNIKTGLNVDHIIDKHNAIDSWIGKLADMDNDRK